MAGARATVNTGAIFATDSPLFSREDPLHAPRPLGGMYSPQGFLYSDLAGKLAEHGGLTHTGGDRLEGTRIGTEAT